MISKRNIRKLLRYHWSYDIPDDTVERCRDLFIDVLNELADAIVKYHADENVRRENYGLRPKLRLTVNKSFSDEIFKQIADVNTGETGQCNRDTVLSDKQAIEVA